MLEIIDKKPINIEELMDILGLGDINCSKFREVILKILSKGKTI